MLRIFSVVLFVMLFACYSAVIVASDQETRIKVAVIDTGVLVSAKIEHFLCKSEHVSFVDSEPLSDSDGHGTNVTGLIAQNLDPQKHCIVMLKFWKIGTFQQDFTKNVVKGILYATKIHAQFLNMSLGGPDYVQEEHDAIKTAIDSGMNVSVAAGNDSAKGVEYDFQGKIVLKKDSKGRPLCKSAKGGGRTRYHLPVVSLVGADLDKGCIYFPACYTLDPEHFHVVGSSTSRKNQWGGDHVYSNFGTKVKYWENGTGQGDPQMTGTSQATAIHTGKWVGGKLK